MEVYRADSWLGWLGLSGLQRFLGHKVKGLWGLVLGISEGVQQELLAWSFPVW